MRGEQRMASPPDCGDWEENRNNARCTELAQNWKRQKHESITPMAGRLFTLYLFIFFNTGGKKNQPKAGKENQQQNQTGYYGY